MGPISRIGHVNFRVTDQERSKKFFTEALGMEVAEEDPVHGGVFMTFGEDFHNVDVSDARGGIPRTPRPPGLVHVAFVVDGMKALRDAYVRLLEHGVDVHHATNHANQRSIYFKDPDGNGMEIYYEVPEAKRLFWGGRGDTEESLPVSKPGEPIPDWLLEDDWPSPQALEQILANRRVAAPS
jgi:catechol 2,3-dioxygenase